MSRDGMMRHRSMSGSTTTPGVRGVDSDSEYTSDDSEEESSSFEFITDANGKLIRRRKADHARGSISKTMNDFIDEQRAKNLLRDQVNSDGVITKNTTLSTKGSLVPSEASPVVPFTPQSVGKDIDDVLVSTAPVTPVEEGAVSAPGSARSSKRFSGGSSGTIMRPSSGFRPLLASAMSDSERIESSSQSTSDIESTVIDDNRYSTKSRATRQFAITPLRSGLKAGALGADGKSHVPSDLANLSLDGTKSISEAKAAAMSGEMMFGKKVSIKLPTVQDEKDAVQEGPLMEYHSGGDESSSIDSQSDDPARETIYTSLYDVFQMNTPIPRTNEHKPFGFEMFGDTPKVTRRGGSASSDGSDEDAETRKSRQVEMKRLIGSMKDDLKRRTQLMALGTKKSSGEEQKSESKSAAQDPKLSPTGIMNVEQRDWGDIPLHVLEDYMLGSLHRRKKKGKKRGGRKDRRGRRRRDSRRRSRTKSPKRLTDADSGEEIIGRSTAQSWDAERKAQELQRFLSQRNGEFEDDEDYDYFDSTSTEEEADGEDGDLVCSLPQTRSLRGSLSEVDPTLIGSARAARRGAGDSSFNDDPTAGDSSEGRMWFRNAQKRIRLLVRMFDQMKPDEGGNVTYENFLLTLKSYKVDSSSDMIEQFYTMMVTTDVPGVDNTMNRTLQMASVSTRKSQERFSGIAGIAGSISGIATADGSSGFAGDTSGGKGKKKSTGLLSSLFGKDSGKAEKPKGLLNLKTFIYFFGNPMDEIQIHEALQTRDTALGSAGPSGSILSAGSGTGGSTGRLSDAAGILSGTIEDASKSMSEIGFLPHIDDGNHAHHHHHPAPAQSVKKGARFSVAIFSSAGLKSFGKKSRSATQTRTSLGAISTSSDQSSKTSVTPLASPMPITKSQSHGVSSISTGKSIGPTPSGNRVSFKKIPESDSPQPSETGSSGKTDSLPRTAQMLEDHSELNSKKDSRLPDESPMPSDAATDSRPGSMVFPDTLPKSALAEIDSTQEDQTDSTKDSILETLAVRASVEPRASSSGTSSSVAAGEFYYSSEDEGQSTDIDGGTSKPHFSANAGSTVEMKNSLDMEGGHRRDGDEDEDTTSSDDDSDRTRKSSDDDITVAIVPELKALALSGRASGKKGGSKKVSSDEPRPSADASKADDSGYYKRGSIAALRLERDTALQERKQRRSAMQAKKHKDDSEVIYERPSLSASNSKGGRSQGSIIAVTSIKGDTLEPARLVDDSEVIVNPLDTPEDHFKLAVDMSKRLVTGDRIDQDGVELKNVFVGRDAVTWMLSRGYVKSRSEGASVGSRLMSATYNSVIRFAGTAGDSKKKRRTPSVTTLAQTVFRDEMTFFYKFSDSVIIARTKGTTEEAVRSLSGGLERNYSLHLQDSPLVGMLADSTVAGGSGDVMDGLSELVHSAGGGHVDSDAEDGEHDEDADHHGQSSEDSSGKDERDDLFPKVSSPSGGASIAGSATARSPPSIRTATDDMTSPRSSGERKRSSHSVSALAGLHISLNSAQTPIRKKNIQLNSPTPRRSSLKVKKPSDMASPTPSGVSAALLDGGVGIGHRSSEIGSGGSRPSSSDSETLDHGFGDVESDLTRTAIAMFKQFSKPAQPAKKKQSRMSVLFTRKVEEAKPVYATAIFTGTQVIDWLFTASQGGSKAVKKLRNRREATQLAGQLRVYGFVKHVEGKHSSFLDSSRELYQFCDGFIHAFITGELDEGQAYVAKEFGHRKKTSGVGVGGAGGTTTGDSTSDDDNGTDASASNATGRGTAAERIGRRDSGFMGGGSSKRRRAADDSTVGSSSTGRLSLVAMTSGSVRRRDSHKRSESLISGSALASMIAAGAVGAGGSSASAGSLLQHSSPLMGGSGGSERTSGTLTAAVSRSQPRPSFLLRAPKSKVDKKELEWSVKRLLDAVVYTTVEPELFIPLSPTEIADRKVNMDNLKRQLRDKFEHCDRQKRGAVDKKEFESWLEEFNIYLFNDDLRTLFDSFDELGTGLLDYNAFVDKRVPSTVPGISEPNATELIKHTINLHYSVSKSGGRGGGKTGHHGRDDHQMLIIDAITQAFYDCCTVGDSAQTGRLTKEEFRSACRKHGVTTYKGITWIFNYISKNKEFITLSDWTGAFSIDSYKNRTEAPTTTEILMQIQTMQWSADASAASLDAITATASEVAVLKGGSMGAIKRGDSAEPNELSESGSQMNKSDIPLAKRTSSGRRVQWAGGGEGRHSRPGSTSISAGDRRARKKSTTLWSDLRHQTDEEGFYDIHDAVEPTDDDPLIGGGREGKSTTMNQTTPMSKSSGEMLGLKDRKQNLNVPDPIETAPDLARLVSNGNLHMLHNSPTSPNPQAMYDDLELGDTTIGMAGEGSAFNTVGGPLTQRLGGSVAQSKVTVKMEWTDVFSKVYGQFVYESLVLSLPGLLLLIPLHFIQVEYDRQRAILWYIFGVLLYLGLQSTMIGYGITIKYFWVSALASAIIIPILLFVDWVRGANRNDDFNLVWWAMLVCVMFLSEIVGRTVHKQMLDTEMSPKQIGMYALRTAFGVSVFWFLQTIIAIIVSNMRFSIKSHTIWLIPGYIVLVLTIVRSISMNTLGSSIVERLSEHYILDKIDDALHTDQIILTQLSLISTYPCLFVLFKSKNSDQFVWYYPVLCGVCVYQIVLLGLDYLIAKRKYDTSMVPKFVRTSLNQFGEQQASILRGEFLAWFAVGIRTLMQNVSSMEEGKTSKHMRKALNDWKSAQLNLMIALCWILGPLLLTMLMLVRVKYIWNFSTITQTFNVSYMQSKKHWLYMSVICLVTMGFIVSVTEVASSWIDPEDGSDNDKNDE